MRIPGGPEAALLCHSDPGVYIVAAKCGELHTPHTFVYKNGTHPEVHILHCGVIVDNRKTAPIRAIEKSDLESVQVARHAINSFFRGETRIDFV